MTPDMMQGYAHTSMINICSHRYSPVKTVCGKNDKNGVPYTSTIYIVGIYLQCNYLYYCVKRVASSPGHSQILSRSHGETSGEGLGSKLRHGPEIVDSVSTNRVHITY